jgi:hypothetical protein
MIDASKRNGRVRRDHLNDEYWTERFMFARRLGELIARSDPRDRDDRPSERVDRRTSKRRAALRVLEEVAGVLLRRPGR